MQERDGEDRPDGAPPRRRRGRPRSEGLRRAILRAAAELLEAHGIEGTTVEAIAARARVGKQTIYRRWPTRAAVLVDAFLSQRGEPEALPDTGTLRRDLVQCLAAAVAMASDPASRRSVAGLAAAGLGDEEVGALFRERWVAASRVPLRTALERGRQRGELDPESDVELLIDLLLGAVWYRAILCGGRLDHAYAEAAIAAVVGGIAAAPPAGTDPRKPRSRRLEAPPDAPAMDLFGG